MQIRQVLMDGVQSLKSVSDSPQIDAEVLLGHVLTLTRMQLFMQLNDAILFEQEESFRQLLQRRIQGEPIAYIIGYREFWSLNLKVTAATLIPRPETEQLVEIALQKFPADKPIRVVDLGTGSGAIALALAYERPKWEVVATDYSIDALTVAKQNAQHLQLQNIYFRQGSWCHALHRDEKFQLIISNPPYIAQDDPYLQSTVKAFEPSQALFTPQHGFQALYSIIEQAQQYLTSDAWLLLEHGYQQKKKLNDFLSLQGYVHIENYVDFSDIFRVCAAQFDFTMAKT